MQRQSKGVLFILSMMLCVSLAFAGSGNSNKSKSKALKDAIPEGGPEIQMSDSLKYFVWIDGDELNIRWVAEDGKYHKFSGDVTCEDKGCAITGLQGVTHGWGDDILQTKTNKIEFARATHYDIDGFSLKVSGQSVKIDLAIDGKKISGDNVLLGATKEPSANVPFTLPVTQETIKGSH